MTRRKRIVAARYIAAAILVASVLPIKLSHGAVLQAAASLYLPACAERAPPTASARWTRPQKSIARRRLPCSAGTEVYAVAAVGYALGSSQRAKTGLKRRRAYREGGRHAFFRQPQGGDGGHRHKRTKSLKPLTRRPSSRELHQLVSDLSGKVIDFRAAAASAERPRAPPTRCSTDCDEPDDGRGAEDLPTLIYDGRFPPTSRK